MQSQLTEHSADKNRNDQKGLKMDDFFERFTSDFVRKISDSYNNIRGIFGKNTN